MDDLPDIYADAFSITVTPYGVTLTVSRSIPVPDGTGPQTVGRIRMGHQLAHELGQLIAQYVKVTVLQEPPTTTSSIKH